MLESALARPVNRSGYEAADVVALSALHCVVIAKSHPFIDGNNRMAFAALATFLALDGLAFTPGEADTVVAMLKLAAGKMDEAAFAGWVRDHVHPRVRDNRLYANATVAAKPALVSRSPVRAYWNDPLDA